MSGPTTHHASMVGLHEGMAALIAHMDDLASRGWQPFHLHEALVDGVPCMIVYSRSVEKPAEGPGEAA